MRNIPLCLSLLVLFGCATAQSYRKPGVDFSKYNKIAIVKFDASESGIGQQVADTLSFYFVKRGFTVIERSQLSSIIDESKFMTSGLTEQNKSPLEVAGIDAIVVGAVSQYRCVPHSDVIFIGKSPLVMNTNNCNVSISMKMLDIHNGDILWSAVGAHSRDAINMTVDKVLQEVLVNLEKKLPSAKFMTGRKRTKS